MVFNYEVVAKESQRVHLGSLKPEEFDELVAAMEAARGTEFSEIERYKLKANAKDNAIGFFQQAAQALTQQAN
jgi:hypothetical protein